MDSERQTECPLPVADAQVHLEPRDQRRMKDLAVVLVSGGMDSCVAAAIAVKSHTPAFLHLNYGQRTERRELKAFNDIADFYRVEPRLVVNVEHLAQIGGPNPTDRSIPVGEGGLKRKENPPSHLPFPDAH